MTDSSVHILESLGLNPGGLVVFLTSIGMSFGIYTTRLDHAVQQIEEFKSDISIVKQEISGNYIELRSSLEHRAERIGKDVNEVNKTLIGIQRQCPCDPSLELE